MFTQKQSRGPGLFGKLGSIAVHLCMKMLELLADGSIVTDRQNKLLFATTLHQGLLEN